MVKLKSLITERVDFYEIATQLVKKAGLKSKVKFTNTGDNKADYNVDDDTIRIKPTSRFKDFLVTVFHEIDHAKDAQRLGKKKYKQQYEIEMNKAVQRGGDAHDDNFYEKKAGLKSKIEFVNTGNNKADYNVDNDTIRIKPTSRFKDFLVTVFHEIDHAKDAQRMGKEEYKDAYEKEMNKAVQKGLDAHDDNFYEKKAEKYGRKMAKNYLRINRKNIY